MIHSIMHQTHVRAHSRMRPSSPASLLQSNGNINKYPSRAGSPSSASAFFSDSAGLSESSRDFQELNADARTISRSEKLSPKLHTTLSDTTTTTTTTTTPLLLEGNSYQLSEDGVARTLYRLGNSGFCRSRFMLEEHYNLDQSKKKFILRVEDTVINPVDRTQSSVDSKSDTTVNLGKKVEEVILQEMSSNAFKTAGTGATTWESSILMSIFFRTNLEALVGDVLELGSGLGLGGILCKKPLEKGSSSCLPTNLTKSLALSMTLSDHSQLVLEQCKKNIEAAGLSSAELDTVKVDWHDFLSNNSGRHALARRFDTVVACDCAYKKKDILALAATIWTVLRNDKSQAHIFGPYNRIGLDELIRVLKEEFRMQVTVKSLKMERYRLDANPSVQHCSEGFPYTSSYNSDFLHIVCSLKQNEKESQEINVSMDISDID